ncbi:MAG: DNA gyrase inhibitor YacG [Rhodobacteraceae bacterium]|nr:MAG: DNA gyrase inhibitor YacG [Paracoccaceae bacterium]
MSCPICQKAVDQKFKPFCSKRCADVDLGKWLNESYAIPAPLEDLSEEDEIALMAAVQTKH